MAIVRRTHLAQAVRKEAGLTHRVAQCMVETLVEEMASRLAAGEGVGIYGFGSFAVRDKTERPGRNPRTQEAVTAGFHSAQVTGPLGPASQGAIMRLKAIPHNFQGVARPDEGHTPTRYRRLTRAAPLDIGSKCPAPTKEGAMRHPKRLVTFRPLLIQASSSAGLAHSQATITRIPLGVDLRAEGGGGVQPVRRSVWQHLMPWRRAQSGRR